MRYDSFANLETLGICRRGYFIEGMGGAQFALPGAVERLRSGPARTALESEGPPALVLAAADAAQPYGAALPWPKREGARAARVAGAYVVSLGGEPVLYVERGGRSLVPLRDPEEEWLRPARAGRGVGRDAAARRGRLPCRSASRRSTRLRGASRRSQSRAVPRRARS